jgi:hypothetical protein
MPYVYTVDPQQGGAFFRAHGLLTGDELIRTIALLFQDPAARGVQRGVLADFRAVTSMDIAPDHMRDVMELERAQRAHIPPLRMAIVPNRSDMSAIMLRLYVTLVEQGKGGPHEPRLFTTIEEAEAWTGLQMPAPASVTWKPKGEGKKLHM